MQDSLSIARELLIDKGVRVDINTPACVIYKSEHVNCKGCASEVGCKKLVEIGTLMLSRLEYKGKSFEDSLNADEEFKKKLDGLLG